MLAPLLDLGSTDLLCICDHFKLNVSKLRQAINRCLEELKVGNSRTPTVLALPGRLARRRLADLLARAIAAAHPLWCNCCFHSYARPTAPTSPTTPMNSTRSTPTSLRPGSSISPARRARTKPPAPQKAPPPPPPAAAGTGEALAQFTYDLTAKARDGRIDPVIGREREIRQCVDILMRRFQNNPLILGEPGTGKTAIAEGLAPAHRRRRRPARPSGHHAPHPRRRPAERWCLRQGRIRTPAQAGYQGGQRLQRRRQPDHPVHRRSTHAHRRWRRRQRCGQPAQARTRPRRAADDRRHNLRRTQEVHRERPALCAAFRPGQTRRAVRARLHRHAARHQGQVREAPQGARP